MKTVNLSRGSHISAGVDRRLTVNSGSIKLTVAGEFETSCLTGEIDIDGSERLPDCSNVEVITAQRNIYYDEQ